MCVRRLSVSMVLLLLFASLGCQVDESGAAGDPVVETAVQRYDFVRRSMGVEFRILLFAPSAETAEAAAQAAYARIDELDRALSHYKPDSELNRLVRAGGRGSAIEVSADLYAMLALAQDYGRLSDGAFDVTVGPLTALWRKARRIKRLPTEEERQAALERVGQELIHLDARAHSVRLGRADMALDLGGIAKGYAVDCALEALKARGITRALVDGSGDIAVWDAPPNEEGWTIAVSPTGELETRYLTMRRGAIATSGDSYGRVVIQGRRYSHIVDPRTGLGLVDTAAVTVLASNCTQADALATVVSLLGPERGIEVVGGKAATGAIIHRKKGRRPTDETLEIQYPKDLLQLPFVLSTSPRGDSEANRDDPAVSAENDK